jgi:hypothetical protein
MATTVSLAVSLLCLCILGLSATAWWPYEYVTRLELKVVGQPRPGGVLSVEVDYCKPNEAAPTVERWTLINEVTISLDAGTASLPAGCHVTRRVFALPSRVPSGHYRVQVEGLYEPWPWRRVPYLQRSDVFEIVQ